MKRVAILGGFGFLGKNLNIALSDQALEVLNYSRTTGCDMRDLPVLVDHLQHIMPNIIVNAAANVGSITYVGDHAAEVVHDNTLMYLNLYRAVAQVDPKIKIINIISNCSYPGDIDIQQEDSWWSGAIHQSVESYGMPKKMGWMISRCYARQHGVRTVNLIVPNAYGPYDYADEQRTHAMNGIIMRMITAKKANHESFTVWGTGTPVREWIYMMDVARAIREIIQHDMMDLPDPINIAQRHGISINQSVDIIRRLLKYPVEVQHDTTKPDGAPVKILDDRLFRQHFPDFEFTDHEWGIRQTINYYETLL